MDLEGFGIFQCEKPVAVLNFGLGLKDPLSTRHEGRARYCEQQGGRGARGEGFKKRSALFVVGFDFKAEPPVRFFQWNGVNNAGSNVVCDNNPPNGLSSRRESKNKGGNEGKGVSQKKGMMHKILPTLSGLKDLYDSVWLWRVK